jgi:lysophospholipase L1-like esterase
LLLLAVLGFAAGEAYVRLKFAPPEQGAAGPLIANGQHPYYMFTGVPGSSGRMASQMGGATEADNTYTLNSLGFRIERPLVKSKPEGELRIFVLGASTIFLGTPLAKTVPGQIESELRRRGFSNATVYNFGVVSAVSGQGLALLTHLLTDYAPDVVVFYGGGNDIVQPYQFDPRPGFPIDFVRIQVGTQLLAGNADLRTALASQLFRSRLIELIFAPRMQEVRLPMGALRKAVGYGTPEWERAAIESLYNNMRRMCRIGHAFDFKFYAVFQPFIFQKSPWSEAETQLRFGDANFAAYMRRQHERSATAFARLQAESGNDGMCRFVDLSQIFANDPRSLFWDFSHVNNDGNAAIGAAIAQGLARTLLARPAP